MELEVTPPLDESEQRVLVAALERAGVVTSSEEQYGRAWRLASFREGAERDGAEIGYAPSPRRTRGATRA